MDKTLLNFKKSDIFTPDNISKIMASKLNNSGTLLDPAVGTGNLLKFINVNDYSSIDVYDIKQKYLDAIRLNNITKHCGDFIKLNIKQKYNNIILNPPYIRIQDLSTEYRKYLKEEFNQLNKGLVDLYFAFIIKCLDLLDDNGIMVSVTPNTFLYNKGALLLRKYLIENKYIKEIIDYKSNKIFDNASVYCCITIFSKSNKPYLLYNNKKIKYDNINTNDYSIFNTNNNTLTLKSLCKISNGIATLRDKIYIHNEKLYDEPCWKLITNSKCKKYIIFPYNNGIIIPEIDFKQNNPKTYKYLLDNKDELAKRDKGNKKYPTWYAYGRSQSLKISLKSLVIYIPTFIDPNNLILNKTTPILHHSCLCIEPNKNEDIDTIINSIKTNIKYLSDISSKRGSGWINITSSNLYKLPITKK